MRRQLGLILSVLIGLGCGGDGYRPSPVPPDPQLPHKLDGGLVGGDGAPVGCSPVTISFAGVAATVAGNPMGLDSSARTALATGSFSYVPCRADQNPADDKRGEYEHLQGASFQLHVAGLSITGSGQAVVTIENTDLDTFRWRDGHSVVDPKPRTMSVNGQPRSDLRVDIAITDASGAAFSDDALPLSFPMLQIASYPHTFAVADAGGTLLLQLQAMSQE